MPFRQVPKPRVVSLSTIGTTNIAQGKSMGIPHTYYDGNPEDRAYVRDFWAWLEQQPQQAWLYYARNANWDQAEDMFVDMVRHPRCDRALASWLFWSSDPSYFIHHGTRPPSERWSVRFSTDLQREGSTTRGSTTAALKWRYRRFEQPRCSQR